MFLIWRMPRIRNGYSVLQVRIHKFAGKISLTLRFAGDSTIRVRVDPSPQFISDQPSIHFLGLVD